MLINILIGLAILLVILIMVIATRPGHFRYTRAANIAAPPATVFGHVNDFHQWQAWSPWAKLDPDCRNSFAGAPSGKGAVFTWAGNKKVGEGSMTILESQPATLIRIDLKFLKPFKAENTAEFTFDPDGSQTKVNWSMYGKCNFISKAFNLFIDCDKMVGKDFEKGLAQLKAVVEATGH